MAKSLLIVPSLVSVYFFLCASGVVLQRTENRLAFQDIGSAVKVEETIPLIVGQSLGQRFVSNFPHLFSVGVFVSVPEKVMEGELVFHLKDSPTAAVDLVRNEVKISDLRVPMKYYQSPLQMDLKTRQFYHYVEFDPLTDSCGKEYYFYLEFLPEHGQEKLLPIQIGRVKAPEIPRGLRKGNEPWNLAFVTACAWKGNWQDVVGVFWKRFNQDYEFSGGYFTLIVILTLVLIGTTFTGLKRK